MHLWFNKLKKSFSNDWWTDTLQREKDKMSFIHQNKMNEENTGLSENVEFH